MAGVAAVAEEAIIQPVVARAAPIRRLPASPRKIEAVETASSPAARAAALSELAYLLNDNVEVITAPPQPEV